MAQLTDEQEDLILQRIVADQVNNTHLQHDLLDHYCCHIEAAMEQGDDFDTAYTKAFRAITPNGMHEIQEELFFLLTFKTQTNMKRIIYGTGFLAAFLISTSFLFRIQHWPGANVLNVAGFATLIFATTAILINAMKFTKMHTSGYNTRMYVGFAAALLISVGSIFKSLHYPGASIQIVLGMALLNFVFLPMFFFHLYRQSLHAK